MSINALADWPEEQNSELTNHAKFTNHGSLSIECLIDRQSSQLSHIYTRGLWSMGIPELCVSPPASLIRADVDGWDPLRTFLAQGLVGLGIELIARDDFEIPPYADEFEGRTVQLWLGGQEPVEDPVAIALPEVDTLFRVECSLWHRPR